jgi:SAM-dependent methyltransferase
VAWDQLRSSYDTVAGKYETRFLDELTDKPEDRQLLETFAGRVDDPVVELGCGPGQIGAYVRRRGPRVYGLDLSAEMAARAKTRLDGAMVADLRSLPVASGRLGGLLAFYSLIHIPRPQLGDVAREIHRVLRPGGRVLLAVHEGEGLFEGDEFLGESVPFVATLFELDDLVDEIRASGLDVIRAERRMPYESESGTVRLHVEALRPPRA